MPTRRARSSAGYPTRLLQALAQNLSVKEGDAASLSADPREAKSGACCQSRTAAGYSVCSRYQSGLASGDGLAGGTGLADGTHSGIRAWHLYPGPPDPLHARPRPGNPAGVRGR
jgi:hypothetical protein